GARHRRGARGRRPQRAPGVREHRLGEAQGVRPPAHALPGLAAAAMSERRALEVASASGLIVAGHPLLVMLSGGADSVCLLAVARELGADVRALHVNYRLRPGADEDEAHCRALCERLGVELIVERPELPPGNVQAAAREARYAL